MFQFALAAELFQFRARGPSIRPLLQFPNRRQTAEKVPSLPPVISFYSFIKHKLLWGNCCAPPAPLNGCADRWQQK